MPVIGRGGEVLGGLFLGHERVGVFLESHEELLAGIAVQASIAIANAQSCRRGSPDSNYRARERSLSIAPHMNWALTTVADAVINKDKRSANPTTSSAGQISSDSLDAHLEESTPRV